jgi:hypothetical protein
MTRPSNRRKADVMKASWLLPLSVSLCGAAVPLTACSSNKNHEERQNTPEAQAAVESDPSVDDLDDDLETCIGTCLPDPGSRPVDCAEQEAGYQYEWAWDLSSGKALATYTYDDNTATVLSPGRNGWEPEAKPVELCGPKSAVRFRGGLFTEYGGGFGTSFITPVEGNRRDSMPPRMPNLLESPEFPGESVDGAFDLREWEGIAIWVRRGPNGQATLRVSLTERNSSEDLNTSTSSMVDGVWVLDDPEKDSRYCRRYRLCGCPPQSPCTEVTPGAWRCVGPDGTEGATCGPTRCKEENTSTDVSDALFHDKPCELAVTSDGLSAAYCYDPATDPVPPAKRERCGNPFSRPVTVGLDWQLIRVPFTELRQADEGHVADEMDLASVKQLVFTHTTGWIDFWVANIGFYRRPQQ